MTQLTHEQTTNEVQAHKCKKLIYNKVTNYLQGFGSATYKNRLHFNEHTDGDISGVQEFIISIDPAIDDIDIIHIMHVDVIISDICIEFPNVDARLFSMKMTTNTFDTCINFECIIFYSNIEN